MLIPVPLALAFAFAFAFAVAFGWLAASGCPSWTLWRRRFRLQLSGLRIDVEVLTNLFGAHVEEVVLRRRLLLDDWLRRELLSCRRRSSSWRVRLRRIRASRTHGRRPRIRTRIRTCNGSRIGVLDVELADVLDVPVEDVARDLLRLPLHHDLVVQLARRAAAG